MSSRLMALANRGVVVGDFERPEALGTPRAPRPDTACRTDDRSVPRRTSYRLSRSRTQPHPPLDSIAAGGSALDAPSCTARTRTVASTPARSYIAASSRSTRGAVSDARDRGNRRPGAGQKRAEHIRVVHRDHVVEQRHERRACRLVPAIPEPPRGSGRTPDAAAHEPATARAAG